MFITRMRLVKWGTACVAGLVLALGIESVVRADDPTQANVCFPTCGESDGRFLQIVDDPTTFSEQKLSISVNSAPSATKLNIAVFDGERTGFWDGTGAPHIQFRLYRDAAGDGSGQNNPLNLVGDWASNVDTFPDNGWFELGPIDNATEGVTSVGCSGSCPFRYVLVVEMVAGSATNVGGNNFKLRTDGTLGLRSNIFAFYGPNPTATLWPGGAAQAAANYDGKWSFAFSVRETSSEVVFWDGDFDFGDFACADKDIDDPNTPNNLTSFPFSSPTASAEGVGIGIPVGCASTGAGIGSPFDDSSILARRRSPNPALGKNILYELVTPDGTRYLNANPSGNSEWEKFSLSTQPFNASTMDYQVPSLPLGTYTVELQGLDLGNVNFWYFDYNLLGLPPNGPPAPEDAFYTIERYVWFDTDRDGIFDGSESGIAGVRVIRTDTTSGAVETATTDSTGKFAFRVAEGDYSLTVDSTNFNSGQPLNGLNFTGGNGFGATGEFVGGLELGPLNPYERRDFGYVTNAPPTAESDATLCLCSGNVTIDVLANDTDLDNDELTVTAVSTAAHGITTLNGDGTVSYAPTSGYQGVDTFTYTVADGHGGTATGTVSITSTNNPAVLNNDSAQAQTGAPVTVAVLANDSDPDVQTLSVASVTQAGNGTVVLNANGTVTYTPDPGFAGTDTFTYTVTDGCAEATATVTITVNTPPTPVNDTATCLCTGNTTLDLLANDTDANNDTLTISALTQPAHGTVVLGGDNRTVTYTTTGGFVGVDTFTYTVGDGHGGSATGTVTITNTNNAPVLVADAASTQAITPVTIAVLSNDSDVDATQTLSVASITQAGNGTVVLNADGTVTYTPNAGFAGTDTFTYTVTDGCAEVTTTVTITVNAPPTPVNDTAACLCTGNTTLDLLANDTDANNDTLTIAALTQPAHGTAVLAADNRTVTYTTTGGFVGIDTFTYTVGDGHGGTATGTVTITNTNTAPVLVADAASTQAITPVTITVLANDSDVDATQTLSVASITQAGNGTVVLNANGTVTYTPNAGFAGTDTFTYTVTDGCAEVTTTVTITVNAPPTPVNDTAACLCTGNTTLDLLANDTDANNDTLTISALTQPAHGTVVLAADNRTVTYTTTGGFVGIDTFTYTVGDGHGGTATGTVTITNTNNAPVLVADAASTQAVTPVTIAVLSNDSDVDATQTLSVASITQAGNGTVVLNANGTVTYTPNAGFAGTDTFTYTVTDGCAEVTTTVTITVNAPPTPVNDTAACLCTGNTTLDLLANDTDANNDTLTISALTQPAHGTVVLAADNRTVTYTTTGGFVGIDTFTYTVGDGHGGTAVGTVTITNTNNAPVLVADAASTQAVTPVTIAVLSNDSDVDATQALSVASITQAGNGTVVLNANGTVTYTPNAGFAGTDTFTYTVTDGCAEVTTTVTITVNAPPTPVNDAAACLCTGNTTLDLLANDTDANNDTLTIAALTQPAHGTVVLAADNRTVTYTTTGGFVGIDTFTYTVGDGHGGTATGTVTITNTNNAPVLVADAASTQAVTPVTIAVLSNDSDVDATQTLSVASITQAGNGTVVLNANGTVTYTPNAGFAGTDTFTYTVTDGCAEVTTTVTITVNAPPTPVNDTAACLCTGNTTLDLLANDTDANNDTLTIAALTQPAHGTVVLAGDNRTVTYTTSGGFVGIDTFTYTVGDGHGGSATGTVTITNTNNAPVLVADSASTQTVTPVTIAVLSNDSDVDATQTLSVASITQAGNGTVVLNANGTVTYTPNAGFAGTDTFTYTVTDGCAEVTTTVTITVNAPPTPVNDTAACLCTGNTTLDLLANDTDANNDTLTISALTQPAHGTVVLGGDNRTVTYTTTGGFVGVDTFTYTVGDGHGGTATGTVTITNTNNAPVLVADAASTQAVTPVTIAVLSNDSDVDATQTLSVASITQAGNGTVVLNANGTVTYTPNAGFAGTDTFTYTVTDGCAEVTTTVTITVNAPPTPVNDTAACLCTGNTTLDLLANDTDANNDTLTISAVTQPAHGTVVLAGDNRTVTYTTSGGFVGIDTFTYTVGDGHGGSATGTVTITNTNNAPVLVADSASTQTVTPVTIAVLSNDSDVDATQTLSVASITQAGNGTVVLNANGTVTYTPNAGFAGTDTFTYTVTDGCAEVTTTVTIMVNAPPTPVNDTAACLCTGNTTLDLLANDTDANNDTLTISALTQPAHGTVVLAADNRTVTYTTTGGFVGLDTFTYTVGDGHGGTATGTVTITNTNTAPVLVADAASTQAITPVTITVLANDSDVDATQTLSVASITQAGNGTVVLNANGTVTYTPNAGFAGTDTFTYTVTDGCAEVTTTVTITVNAPPTPVNDTAACLCTGNTTLDLLANDTDANNDTLAITALTQPAHGTVVLAADNRTVTYTTTGGFVGIDTFTYTVGDGHGGTATGTVTITNTNNAPVLVADSASTQAITPVTIAVLSNDSDVDATQTLSVASITQAGNGTVVLNENGTVTYTPNAGFAGTDTFTYTVTDGCAEVTTTVTITVNAPPTPVNDTAACLCTGNTTLDLLANDTDANNDTLAITALTQPAHGTVVLAADNRTVTYTTSGGFVGIDTFTYTVGDGHGGSATGTVTITNTNNAPVLVADSASTQAITPVTIAVLSNDSDVDATQTLSVASITHAGNGTVVLNENGTVTYTPNAGFAGTDTFTYTVTDGCAEVTTTVTITVNAPPTPVNDTAACLCTGNTTLDLLANDTDANNDTLTISALTQPAHGTVVLAGDNRTVTYTTSGGFVGIDTFTYTVGDGHGGSATGTVTITNTNNAPVLVADTGTTVAGSPVMVNVLANDSDPDNNQALTVSSFTQAANGTVTMLGGVATYTPNAGFRGTDTFTYTVKDGCEERTATVTMTVTNRPPSPTPDTSACLCTGASSVNVLTNDTDPDNDGLTVTAVTQGAHGVVTFAANGSVTYTPTNGYVGPDTFTYTVSDGQGGTATGAVTVTSTNQAPVLLNDAGTTASGTATIISVLANDHDPDGQSLTITGQTDGANGATVLNANGTLTYTPNPGFTGTDTFTYTVKDGCVERTATVTVIVEPPPVCLATGYTTYSQGGWGSKPSGNNPGMLLKNNFSTVYEDGYVKLGTPGTKWLKFTSAYAIQNFLPQGGTPKVLTSSATNPTSSSAGNFAAQLLALQLAVDFSAAGVTQEGLGRLVMLGGPLAGKTVDEILVMANKVIGGQTSALPSGMSVSGLSSVLESIIMNFHEGTENGGLLGCGGEEPEPPCVAKTFTLNQNQSSGSAGNVRTFSTSGTSVKVLAYSRDKSNGNWAKAFGGAFGTAGLGVTDSSENGSGTSHTVDNYGRNNYLVFVFDQPVVLTKAYIGYVSGDSDAQVWVGTLPNAYTSTPMFSDAILSGLGAPETSNGGSTARWMTFNEDGVSGNVLVIAAHTAQSNDYFKIAKLEIECATEPEPDPSISLVKKTNGTNNNAAPGVMVAAGSTVTWTYEITNTGNVALTNLSLSDDKIGAVSCPVTSLAAGASTTCTATGTAVAGQYANMGTVSGKPPVGPTVTAQDPDHYFGSAPAITLVKKTNGTNNNSAPGVEILVGAAVTWTYEVRNTGNVLLTNLTLSDDKVGSVSCPVSQLAPGATTTCTATGTAVAGQYTNMGTVTGKPPVGPNVTAQDPDHYFGKTPAPPCVATTFIMNINENQGSGTLGNVRSFSASGAAMKVMSFSRDKSNGSWAKAFTGAFSAYGLGVTDSGENGSGTSHTVDNNGRTNYMMFVFDRPVVVKKATLGYVSGDSDAQVWVGTIPTAYTTAPMLSDSLLNSLGSPETSLGGSSARTINFNNVGESGNVVVIAALTTESNDYFKVAKLESVCASTPPPSDDDDDEEPVPVCAFRTQTQGGWGSSPNGSNPGAFLESHFSSVFGTTGVTIGGTKKLKFTSAAAVKNFLPQGGTASKLTANGTNVTSSSAGVLAGQVLALKLSVAFSNEGVTPEGLGGLKVKSGPLAGKTVTQVLAMAETALGGGTVSGVSISTLNSVVNAINNNFVDGTTNKGYLLTGDCTPVEEDDHTHTEGEDCRDDSHNKKRSGRDRDNRNWGRRD